MVGGKFQPLPCAGRAALVAGVAFFFIQQCPAVAICFEYHQADKSAQEMLRAYDSLAGKEKVAAFALCAFDGFSL